MKFYRLTKNTDFWLGIDQQDDRLWVSWMETDLDGKHQSKMFPPGTLVAINKPTDNYFVVETPEWQRFVLGAMSARKLSALELLAMAAE